VRAALSPAEQDHVLRAFADGMHAVFLIAFIIALVSFTLSFLLPRVRGRSAAS